MMKSLDVVVLTTSVSGVPAGSVGTIVDYRTDGPTLMIEFDEIVLTVDRGLLRPWRPDGTDRIEIRPLAVAH